MSHILFRSARLLVILCTSFICCWVALNSLSEATAAPQPSVTTEITPKSGQEDDLFIFTVKIAGVASLTSPPRLTNVLDFDAALLGPQTSVTIVNGVIDSHMAYVYQLTPRRSGALKTPRVEILVGRNLITSPELVVEVTPSASVGNPAKSSQATPLSSEQLFVKQLAAPSKVYQGQQLTNSLSLYTQVELAEFHLTDFSADGFWQERLVDNERSITEVNGQTYTRVEHAKALYPLTTGALQIPARTVIAKVPIKKQRRGPSAFNFGGDLFQQLFQTIEIKEVTLSSNAASVEVKPLPNPPKELRGLLGPIPIVGATSIRAVYNHDPISSGEVKPVSVEVTSQGNLLPLKSLTLSAPEGVKVYEEAPATSSDRSIGKVQMKRVFRFSLVPLKGGLVRIPGIRIAYFDPSRDSYLTASTAEISFPVNGLIMPPKERTTKIPEPATSRTQLDSVSPPLPTLPPIPRAPNLEYREPSLAASLSQAISFQLVLLILAAICALLTLRSIFVGRLSRASSTTQTALSLTGSRIESFTSIEELEEGLREALAERLPNASKNESYETLRARARSTIPSIEVAQSVCLILDELECARYGRTAGLSEEHLPTLKTRLRELANTL